MELIGNYIEYIDESWIEHINNHHGVYIPLDLPKHKVPIVTTGFWDTTKIYGIIYDWEDINTPKLTQPPWTDEKFFYWFMKYQPGMICPVHVDNSPYNSKTDSRYTVYNRYVMLLQDYIEGHIFVYNNKLITNYVKGDVYKYVDVVANTYEGNSSNIDRILLHITGWHE
jgi:hypothetical protein